MVGSKISSDFGYYLQSLALYLNLVDFIFFIFKHVQFICTYDLTKVVYDLISSFSSKSKGNI